MVRHNQFRRRIYDQFFEFIKTGSFDMQAFDVAHSIEDLCLVVPDGLHRKSALNNLILSA